ncbi:uncharacterized protein [Osmerus mordax]|uniref:uncharacterized protein isoform X2 n=1 Tax=Osmerus mordax TaxID=8014 RepID=UPI00350FADAC
MAVQQVVSLLALASISAASSPNCEALVKPFLPDDLTPVYGKWLMVLGAADPKPYHEALGSVRNSWMELSATSESQVVTYRWGDRQFGKCHFASTNATISSGATTFTKNLAVHKGQILETCPDCLLWSDNFRNRDYTGRFLLLFTRTGKLDPDYVETFKQQAVCLNFPEPHTYDGETGFGPP